MNTKVSIPWANPIAKMTVKKDKEFPKVFQLIILPKRLKKLPMKLEILPIKNHVNNWYILF